MSRRKKRIIKAERQRRKRNYKKEYRRRIDHGLAKGLTRSQARGHGRAGDIPKSPRPVFVDPSDPRERALQRVKRGETIKDAAKAEGISRERLRRYIDESVEAKREGRRWIITDSRGVSMAICSRARLRWVRVISSEDARKIGHYWVAVNRFLASNDPSHLAPFRETGIRDNAGKYFPFETEPNVLRRLDSAGELSFLDIYKNVR